MKKLLLLFVPIMFVVSCSKVPAGNVGVKVYLLGKSKGVDTEELGVGRYWIGINEELYLFPTFQQNYVWTKDRNEGSKNDESITFQTIEGLDCNADVGISYHLDPKKISVIFQKYRKGIEEITDIFMRNHVRDSFNDIASKYKVEAVYGKGKAQLLKEVQEKVRRSLKEQGIVVDKIYLVGKIRLPKTVVDRIEAKIGATQRAEQRENELREARAEAAKKVALAQGAAKANTVLGSSITATLIKWEKLQIEKKALDKWNGQLPSTMIPGQSLPFVGVGGKK